MNNFKFLPKLGFALFNLFLLLVAIILFFGRKQDFLKITTLQNIWPDFYQHVSNFSISFIMFAGIGFMWLLLGLPFKMITSLGLVIIAANFIYELWIPVLNTTDIVDAYYGLCATLIAYTFLYATKLFGLQVNSKNNPTLK